MSDTLYAKIVEMTEAPLCGGRMSDPIVSSSE